MVAQGHVAGCTVEECSYNVDRQCYAPGIKVGADHAHCDTYTTNPNVDLSANALPDVVRCNIDECRWNVGNDCNAPGVSVSQDVDEADCVTYSPRG